MKNVSLKDIDIQRWCLLLMMWELGKMLELYGRVFLSNIGFKVGDGRKIAFHSSK